MTVAVPGADYSEFAGVGLEGLDVGDFGIARWRIDHNDGLFKNNQNDFAYQSIDVILLNLVKQRVFFPKETDEEHADPLCKSNDFVNGYPGQGFPVDESGFPLDVFNSGAALPCASCAFKDWGPRKPNGKSTPPVCRELFTFTFIALNDEVENTPGIISLKGTSIGPAKKYISQFVQRKWPMFVRSTRIDLDANLYMGRKYYVAKFSGLEEQNPAQFPEFAEIAISAREYLTKPPMSAEDEVEFEENTWSTTQVEDETVKTAPAPPEVDPWATQSSKPATASRPRPATVAQPAPPQASQAPSADSQAVSKPAPPRPVGTVSRPAPTRPVQSTAPVEPAAEEAAVTGPVVTYEDDLPF